jgi:imidazole glycerol-phosphate synthase subunit HisH
MPARVAVVNSRVSNLRNITKAVASLGVTPVVTDKAEDLKMADKVIMPGVGAFKAGMDVLSAGGLGEGIKEAVKAGKPFLGICLGMQLLLDHSEEFGDHKGLGVVPGAVKRLPAGRPKVPHVGWDAVTFVADDDVLGVKKGESRDFYFTHSYAVYPKDQSVVLGAADSGYGPFCAVLKKDNVRACQFHLELSGEQGLRLLKGFIDA